MQKKLKEAINFAKTYSYETAEFVGIYKGKNVYNPIYKSDGEIYTIGLPAYILEKQGKFEWIQGEKSFEIMRFFDKNY